MKKLVLLLLVQSALIAKAQSPIDYPIVAVRSAPQPVDGSSVLYPEVFDPIHHPPSDLVIIEPDGSERVIVSGNNEDAIFDPKTLDGKTIYYVKIPKTMSRNKQRRHIGGMPIYGADIYSLNLETGETIRHTDQSDVPFPGFADWDDPANSFRYGVYNMGPQPLPDGRLIYSSSRRRLAATKNYTAVAMQLHCLHPDGRIECIGIMSHGSALHPELMRDGRIMYSSYESMGRRDQRVWSLWQIHPDGTNWGPLITNFAVTSFHFHTQRTNGKIAAVHYYNKNNWGMGSLMECDEYPTYSEVPKSYRSGWHYNSKLRTRQFKLPPSGLRNLTPWTWAHDMSPPRKDWAQYINCETVEGEYFGKVTHPSAGPNNSILMVYSSGPCNKLKRPEHGRPHWEIRVLEDTEPLPFDWDGIPEDLVLRGKAIEAAYPDKKGVAASPDDLKIIVKSDQYQYSQPRALLSHKEIYGVDPIALPNKVDITKKTGIFGSADAFTGQWSLNSGGKGNPESILIIGTEPNTAKIYGYSSLGDRYASGSTGWNNQINERLRILGEYKFDQEGRPAGDSSFQVQVPADVPFTVAVRAEDGRFLTCGESWKQVRPGTKEVNCGGCHNHAGEPISKEGKFAFSPGYDIQDFTRGWEIPEYWKDVDPIIQEHCMDCHDGSDEDRVVLDASAMKSPLVVGLKAGASILSHRIRGENELEQMPFGRPPLSDEEIRIIDQWIDMGCLIDGGKGAAFQVFSQELFPPEPPPVDPPIEPPVEPPVPPPSSKGSMVIRNEDGEIIFSADLDNIEIK